MTLLGLASTGYNFCLIFPSKNHRQGREHEHKILIVVFLHFGKLSLFQQIHPSNHPPTKLPLPARPHPPFTSQPSWNPPVAPRCVALFLVFLVAGVSASAVAEPSSFPARPRGGFWAIFLSTRDPWKYTTTGDFKQVGNQARVFSIDD